MLQRIRDRISGWIAGVVIALVGGAFVLFGIEYYFDQGGAQQNEVAKVNGVTISAHQVDTAFSQLQQQLSVELRGQPLSSTMTQQLKVYALQKLITQTALFTTLQHDGFRVGMQQVKMMVEQSPQFQDQGKFSEPKMMQALYQANLSPLTFFQHVQSEWLMNQVMNGLTASVFILPNEATHFYGLQHQQRAFGYFIVPMHAFLSKVVVSDTDIKNYYQDHQTAFETPASVSVAYLLLSPKQIANRVTITEADAKAYYESHADNFSKKESFASVKNKIITLLQHQRVNALLTKQSSALADLTYTNPDSLAVAAKTLQLPIQISPMLTKAGEKTGIFSDPKVLAAIFSDSVFKSDNNSDPITLSDGSQLVLRVEKKTPSQPIPLTTVSAKIKAIIGEKQAVAQAGLLAYQLQKKLMGGVSPAVLAKQYALQWHSVPLTAVDAKSSVPAAILSQAFNIAGTQAVSINPQDYAVIQLDQVKKANPAQASAATNQQVNSQLSALWGQVLQHCFVSSVMDHSKIIVTPQK